MTVEEVVKKAQSGDKDAVNQIIEEYSKLVLISANDFFMLGADKEDIIQEGILGLLKAINSFVCGKASFKNYALMCIKRNIISAVKKSHTQKNNLLNNAISIEEFEVNNSLKNESEESIEDRAILKEKIERFSIYLNGKLSKIEKQVFFYLVRGYSYIEIGNILDMKPKQVDNAIQRIRKKSEFWLKKYNLDD